MQIWVDADACPNIIKEIIFRAANRIKIQTFLVANQKIVIPRSEYIHFILVKSGFDVADNYIVQNLNAGDLVITADIPLAAEVIAKDAHALNPRGQLYTKDNIQHRLSLRNFMDEIRSSGQHTGGPAPLGNNEKLAFANAIDRFLVKHLSS
ncbi:MAG: YaiI/YqxD family protein [Pseudomonadota bacterium]